MHRYGSVSVNYDGGGKERLTLANEVWRLAASDNIAGARHGNSSKVRFQNFIEDNTS